MEETTERVVTALLVNDEEVALQADTRCKALLGRWKQVLTALAAQEGAEQEGTLCVARTPEGQVTVERAGAALPLTNEEAMQQAQAEGLTLVVAENTAGYYCVVKGKSKANPFRAVVWRGGKDVHLGGFATAEEAALCVARTPEGQAAAARAAAAPPPARSLTSEEALQQAQAEGITLHVADNTTGYFSVYLTKPGKIKPYKAEVSYGGKDGYLGYFATAEEAALHVARSPEGQAAMERAAVQLVPLTSKEALQQAEAEGITLRVADNKTGYYGVGQLPSRPKPYKAGVICDAGKKRHLGCFATVEEAALWIARSPEAKAAAERAESAAPLTSEEARQQAQAEGLTLVPADNKAGYYGVCIDKPDKPKPYRVTVRRSGNCSKFVHMGSFATAEEAALCVARSPEGQAAAKRAAAAPPLTSKEALQQAQAEGLMLRVAGTKSGYFGVSHQPSCPTKPYSAQVKRGAKSVHLGSFATAEEAALCVARSQAAVERETGAPPKTRSKLGKSKAKSSVKEDGIVPPMPLDAVVKEECMVPPMPSEARWSDASVKQEHEEEEHSDDRPKKKRKDR